jgi:hypothetical protein
VSSGCQVKDGRQIEGEARCDVSRPLLAKGGNARFGLRIEATPIERAL